MNIIMRTVFGSHLYGIDTENSDRDFKGIFMPTTEQILLNRIPKSIKIDSNPGDSKNTKDDVEEEYYSLHYFIALASKGETVALDMVHAPKHCLTHTSVTWDAIVSNKDKFYTKNLKSFVGYAKRQASKYGMKGSRLSDTEKVLKFLKPHSDKLRDIWDDLPDLEHTKKYFDLKSGLRIYEVCNKKFQEAVSIRYIIPILEKYHDDYGHRAKLAKENRLIDWKAVSHAIRAAYQIKEILTKGNITFPLKERDFILDVKLGRLDYTTIVAPKLEQLIDECQILSDDSNLPDKVDSEFWDNFIFGEISSYLRI